MSELEDILNYLETTSLEPHDDYVSEFSYKSQKTLWKYIKDLRLENQELKKQLEAKNIQQKEFIEWLESEIKECKDAEEKYADGDDNSYYNNNELRIEILSKYKEIIGGKDE